MLLSMKKVGKTDVYLKAFEYRRKGCVIYRTFTWDSEWTQNDSTQTQSGMVVFSIMAATHMHTSY